jgi:elongator complex protein 3
MKNYNFDYKKYTAQLLPLLLAIEAAPDLSRRQLSRLIKQHPKADGQVFALDELVMGYRGLAGTSGLSPVNDQILKQLQMKPMRTMSGVTPVTVLTKPFPCPGKCIFCPNDVRMPKSYLSDEPGAQRAERNYFDPYLQTYNRLQAFHNIGHSIEKVELLILGGTWSYYPEAYQIWFIKECFRALNEFGLKDDREQILQRYQQMELSTNDPAKNKLAVHSKLVKGSSIDKSYNQVVSELYVAPERLAGFDVYQSASWAELEAEQLRNETAASRSVGLVVETRPDNISPEEVIRIRRLGCTKTQIGFQSLQDQVLTKNNRGHDVAASRRAVKLLRQAGFKIHAHWMANLYGSSVQLDKQDYLTLFDDPDFRPDELKIYPCSLIDSAELMQYYQRGDWQPYHHDELLEVLTFALMNTPEYCRLTRVIRDIPSTDIVVGNKKTNFRQIAEQALAKAGQKSSDIRAREIRNQEFDEPAVQLNEVEYQTSIGREIFLQFILPESNKIVAFLRLSLPTEKSFIAELTDSALIREIHVYGQAVGIGQKHQHRAQHLGFGTRLINRAKEIAIANDYPDLAVISAVGTRGYYRKKGFTDGLLYQHLPLV